MGRGELEQMIDALVEPRAKNIAANAKAGTNVVARDIKARVLKGVKVAPTYHVQIKDDGHGRPRVSINAKGHGNVVQALIPEHKHQGNVEVDQYRPGRGPHEDNIVPLTEFGQEFQPGMNTVDIKGKLRQALPSAAGDMSGLTPVAKKAAKKKREAAQRPMTEEVSKKHLQRMIDAAVADKGLKKAQADRMRAIVTREPPTPARDNQAVDYINRLDNRVTTRYGYKKADRKAYEAFLSWHLKQEAGDAGRIANILGEAEARRVSPKKSEGVMNPIVTNKGHNGAVLRKGDIIRHFQGGEERYVVVGASGSREGTRIRVKQVGGERLRGDGEFTVHASNFVKVAGLSSIRHSAANRMGVDAEIKGLMRVAGVHEGQIANALLDLFAKHPRTPGESLYNYIKRVRREARPELDRNHVILNGVRKLRREAQAAAGGGAAAAPAEPKPKTEAINAAVAGLTPPADRKGDERFLNKPIEKVKRFNNANVSDTYAGEIDGKRVWLKARLNQAMRQGITPGMDPEREVAASAIADALNVYGVSHSAVHQPMPAGGGAPHNLTIDTFGAQTDAAGGGHSDLGERWPTLVARGGQTAEDGRRIALLDNVIANTDRHHGNGKKKMEGGVLRLIPIDHSLAFNENVHASSGQRQLFEHFRGKSLRPEEVALLIRLRNDEALWTQLKALGLKGQAIALTRKRIDFMIKEKRFLSTSNEMWGNF